MAKETKSELEIAQQRIQQLEAALALSRQKKSVQQATIAYGMLKQGPQTASALVAKTGAKTASDPIYYVRHLLNVDVVMERSTGRETTYRLARPENPVVTP